MSAVPVQRFQRQLHGGEIVERLRRGIPGRRQASELQQLPGRERAHQKRIVRRFRPLRLLPGRHLFQRSRRSPPVMLPRILVGLAPCFSCPAGFYQPIRDQKFCIRCPRWAPYTDGSRAANRIECLVDGNGTEDELPEPEAT